MSQWIPASKIAAPGPLPSGPEVEEIITRARTAGRWEGQEQPIAVKAAGETYQVAPTPENLRRWAAYCALAAADDPAVPVDPYRGVMVPVTVAGEEGERSEPAENRKETEAEEALGLLIVSRHPAAVEFIRRAAELPASVPVLSSVTAEDVRGKVVYGNLPLHLAAEARAVVAVEFTGPPPRGQEYTLADMEAAGARLRLYRVRPLEGCILYPSGEADRDDDDTRLPRISGDGRYQPPPPVVVKILDVKTGPPFRQQGRRRVASVHEATVLLSDGSKVSVACRAAGGPYAVPRVGRPLEFHGGRSHDRVWGDD